MILATLDTSHFSFVALGTDREHAEATMRAAWNKHRREYRGRGVAPFEEFADDVQYGEISPGSALRDGEVILHVEAPEPRGESYTPAGLPRRAAAAARAKGAVIRHGLGSNDFIVNFPNGSWIQARTKAGANRAGQRVGQVVYRQRGATPGAKPPLGDTLEVALNNFVRTAR